MIFGVVLAGGIGSRMGNVDKPKQYLLIGDKPILIHTLEKFFIESEFEKVLVLCPKEWVAHTRNLIVKYLGDTERVVVLAGGETRNETIMNSIDYIEENYGLSEDTIIVTHDSVRPFVTQRIIKENIQYAKEFGACDTAVAATDTIVCSEDGKLISDIPKRQKMYQGQTPQTFQALKLKNLYYSLTDEEKNLLTDAAKIFVMKGEKVHIVEGEVFNIKITYPYDLRVAEALLKGGE
ncbi:MAG TPA: 2-C-methyl-D-erythritol 4-phosphate cytidylyltransferase [Lachnospiraceae bacterium]|nr:2-C-methyl-D-erythritol 4-phosphate cytidylyltransferase [Lachnospiraceae bacterium]